MRRRNGRGCGKMRTGKGKAARLRRALPARVLPAPAARMRAARGDRPRVPPAHRARRPPRARYARAPRRARRAGEHTQGDGRSAQLHGLFAVHGGRRRHLLCPVRTGQRHPHPHPAALHEAILVAALRHPRRAARESGALQRRGMRRRFHRRRGQHSPFRTGRILHRAVETILPLRQHRTAPARKTDEGLYARAVLEIYARKKQQ